MALILLKKRKSREAIAKLPCIEKSLFWVLLPPFFLAYPIGYDLVRRVRFAATCLQTWQNLTKIIDFSMHGSFATASRFFLICACKIEKWQAPLWQKLAASNQSQEEIEEEGSRGFCAQIKEANLLVSLQLFERSADQNLLVV